MSTYMKQLYSHLAVQPQIIAVSHVQYNKSLSELYLRKQFSVQKTETNRRWFPC